MVSLLMRWAWEKCVQASHSFSSTLTFWLDCPIHLIISLSCRNSRHLGPFPCGSTCVHPSQLAARDHSLCPRSEGIAVLGQCQRSGDFAQVLEQERNQLQSRCAVSYLDHKLPASMSAKFVRHCADSK
jgi:hypothetical protein